MFLIYFSSIITLEIGTWISFRFWFLWLSLFVKDIWLTTRKHFYTKKIILKTNIRRRAIIVMMVTSVKYQYCIMILSDVWVWCSLTLETRETRDRWWGWGIISNILIGLLLLFFFINWLKLNQWSSLLSMFFVNTSYICTIWHYWR